VARKLWMETRGSASHGVVVDQPTAPSLDPMPPAIPLGLPAADGAADKAE